MNPYEHAQPPAMPEPPSGLPTAGSQPPAYDPSQRYAPVQAYPPAGSFEHAQPVAYGYDQQPTGHRQPPQTAPAYGYEQAQAPQIAPDYAYEQPYQQAPACPQTPEYHQTPVHQQQPGPAYPQTPAYQQQQPQAQQTQTPYYQPTPPPGGGWGRPPEAPQPYVITAGFPAPAVKSGAGKKIALIAVAALLVVSGGAAFAADAWAKGQVCDAVQGLDDESSGKSSSKKRDDMPTVAELDAAEKGLNSRASLLFFHGDLKEATHDLADDVDTMKTMVAKGNLDDPDAKTITKALALMASLDNHARRAQRACGLPEQSLMGTTA